MFYKSKITGNVYKIENDIYTLIIQDDNNILYQGQLQWLKDGNSIETFDGLPEEIAQAELAKVPTIINQRQMKLQMLYDGISENSILAVINAITDETLKGKIMIEWQYANYFERFNENLISLWLQLGKTEEELNQFFINADKL